MTPLFHVICCRAGFEAALAAELKAKASLPIVQQDAGWVAVEAHRDLPEAPLIFERQRLRQANWLSRKYLKPISDETFGQIFSPLIALCRPWALHAFVPDGQRDESLSRQLGGIERNLLNLCRKKHPGIHDRLRKSAARLREEAYPVLQLACTAEGLWYSVSARSTLSGLHPGGVYRMRMDEKAPSRSYLKIEEALDRMGVQPRPGERVVDLGAAPGGWTYAFQKRGCHVTAVDNGPLKLPPAPEGWGIVVHRLEDGLSFRPSPSEVPVDWLVSDMLVPPGKALGLLRRWLHEKWMHRFICNIKIPQQEPYAALQPLEAFLRDQSRLDFTICQLYHDRREVTVWGILRT